jgi:Domain of unknown function (DUF4397)
MHNGTTMTAIRALLFTLFSALAMSLAGCGGDSSEDGEVRILNASIDYGAVDVYFDDELKQSNVGLGQMSGYLNYRSESNTLKITRTGSTSAIFETTATPGKGTKHVYILYGSDGNLRINQYSENESEAASDKTKVRVLNASPDSGALDFFASTSATSVNDLVSRIQGVGYGATSSWLEIDRGTYRSWFTAAGDKADIRIQLTNVVLEDRKLHTIVLLPTQGGTLVNAIAFNQEGSATKTENNNARLRLVAGLTSGERVAVRTSQGEQILSNSSPSVSSYVLVPTGASTLTVASNGVTFSTLNTDFAAGTDNTLFAFGSTPSATIFRDNNRAPTQSTRAKFRLLNGFSESATGISANADYSPIVSNVAVGAASEYGLVSGGTYSRLDATEANGNPPLYVSSDVTLSSGAVYSLFVMGTRAAPIGILRKDR